MKALFISNDPSIFNGASDARARMREYASHMEELHILSSGESWAEEKQDGNLFLHPVQAPRLFRTHILASRGKRLIKEKDIAIVSAQDPFEHGLAALNAVHGTSAKLHIQVHTDFLSPWFIRSGNWRSAKVHMPFLNSMRRRIADRVLPKAHGIRVVSKRVKDSLIERYGSSIQEPLIIPVAINPAVPKPVPLPPHPFTFALIAVGRLEPEKRIQDILEALALVVKHYPLAGLFIVGEGRERRRLEQKVRELDLSTHVLFLGERSDARGLIGSAQAFIQASAYEGYSRTLVEAALARVPIITTDVGIVGEVFKGYEDVLAAPVADPTALSLHIVGLIEDNQIRQQLWFHAEAVAKAHMTLLGDIPARVAADLNRVASETVS
jgi:glycosyltransferase involved in cell wall biosynthesis